MRVMVLRSIVLAQSMVDAWKEVGGWFPMRERSNESKLDLMANTYGRDGAIINFGDMSFDPTDQEIRVRGIDPDLYYNRPDSVRALTKPGPTRRLIGEFLPIDPREINPGNFSGEALDIWVKAPGQAGQGKTRMTVDWAGDIPQIPADWDIQVHKEGQEYRVVTVGTKVIQINERHGVNGNRNYVWVGVRNAPDPVKTICREAARRLEDERTIIGWDVVHKPADYDDQTLSQTFIFEGNTCPGTNRALVGRIMSQIKGEHYVGTVPDTDS